MNASALRAPALVALSAFAASPVGAQIQVFRLEGTGEERLGFSLALVGDVNADGVDDFAAGAPEHEGGQGRVLVCSGVDGALLLELDDPQAGGELGQSVSAVGDVDLDGVPDVLASARFAGTAHSAGMVYVFSGADGAVIHALSGPWPYSDCGWVVEGLGDVDGDGRPDFAVGDPSLQHTDLLPTFVSVHSGLDGSRIWSVSGGTVKWFGSSLAALGDLDGDGARELAVGASGNGSNDTGAAFVHSGATGALLFAYESEPAGTRIGGHVAAAGDLDGDGTPDWLVSVFDAQLELQSIELRSGADGSFLHRFTNANLAEDAGDVDHDGVSDIWLGRRSFPTVRLVLGATRTVAAEFDAFGVTRCLAGGSDLTGDGAPDLLTGHFLDDGIVAAWSLGCSLAPIASYCTTSPNSAGAGAVMGSSGSTSAFANDFVLETSACPPGQFGLYFYGEDEANAPFGDGVRCIAAPIFRLGPAVGTGSGSATRALDIDALPNAAAPILAGSRWRFQFWYRDPGFGAFGFNLSDGLAVEFCP